MGLFSLVCFPVMPQLPLSLIGFSLWGTWLGLGEWRWVWCPQGPGCSFSNPSALRTVCAATCWPGLPLLPLPHPN